MFSLIPKWIYNNLCDITAEQLASRNIDILFLDFDNTIVPYTSNIPDKEVQTWFATMKKAGIKLCVVSNTKKERAPAFCREHDIDCITHAAKPFQKGIRLAINKYGGNRNAMALVGDQIFTDVLGANLGGITSFLVKPLHLHNFWLAARHWLEKPFIFLGKRRMLHVGSTKRKKD